MRSKIKVLEELQAIDLKIDGRKGERERLLNAVADLDREVEESRCAVSAKQAEQQALRDEKASLEESVLSEAENIHKSEARLTEIKTQKEYQAVLKEIAAAKKVKGELEDQVLQKIGLIDDLQGQIATMEQNLESLEQNIGGRRAELQEGITALDRDIAGDAEGREAAVKELSPAVVNRYTMLREKRQGLAVVEAREGCCLGCNMNIPPQLYNSLFRGDELLTCPHCQRVLYLRKDEAV